MAIQECVSMSMFTQRKYLFLMVLESRLIQIKHPSESFITVITATSFIKKTYLKTLDLTFIHKVDRKMMLLVFAFFYLINVLASGGHIDAWDGVESFLTTESMALKHTAKLDPTVPSQEFLRFNVNYAMAFYKLVAEGKPFDLNIPPEPYYTIRSLLISAVALPFYELALALSLSPLVLVSMLTNSLLIALTSRGNILLRH